MLTEATAASVVQTDTDAHSEGGLLNSPDLRLQLWGSNAGAKGGVGPWGHPQDRGQEDRVHNQLSTPGTLGFAGFKGALFSPLRPEDRKKLHFPRSDH